MQEIIPSSPILASSTPINNQANLKQELDETKHQNQIIDNQNACFNQYQSEFQNYYHQNPAVALLQHHYQNYHTNSSSSFSVNNLANLNQEQTNVSIQSHLQDSNTVNKNWRSTPPSSISSISKNSSPNTNNTNTSSSSESEYYANNNLIENHNLNYDLPNEVKPSSIFATISNNINSTNDNNLNSDFSYQTSSRSNLFPSINSNNFKQFPGSNSNFYSMNQFDSNHYQHNYYNRAYNSSTPSSNSLFFNVNQANTYLSPIDTNSSLNYQHQSNLKQAESCNYEDLDNNKKLKANSLQTSPKLENNINNQALLSSSSSSSFISSPTSISSNKNLTSPGINNNNISNPTVSTTTITSTSTNSTSSTSPSSSGVSSTQGLVTESFEWMKPVKSAPNGKTRTKDKYRVVYSEPQRVELEKEFLFSKYITIKRKSELSQTLHLSERQIKIWFQNRRAKERKSNRKQKQQNNNNNNDVSSTTTKNVSKSNQSSKQNDYSDDEDMDEELDESFDDEESNDNIDTKNKNSKVNKKQVNSSTQRLTTSNSEQSNAFSGYQQPTQTYSVSSTTYSTQPPSYSQYSPSNNYYQNGYIYPQQTFVNGSNLEYSGFVSNQQLNEYNSAQLNQNQHSQYQFSNDYMINRGFAQTKTSSPNIPTSNSSSNSIIQVLSQFQSI